MPPRPLFAVLGLLLFAEAALADNFLRGYAQAVIDLEAAADSIEVIEADARGRVVLAPEECLNDARREQIESMLRDRELVSRIEWRMRDCEPLRLAEGQEPVRKTVVLPAGDLFRPLIADPRQPQTALHYQYSQGGEQDFNAGAVSLGEYLPFFEFALGPGNADVGIEAGVFSLFNLDASSNDLVNTDFLIGLPLHYRDGAWSYLTGIYHYSSHLGDEFILGNPGVDRVNLSYELFRFVASRDYDRLRVYGGGGYLFSTQPSLDPIALQGGAEYRIPGWFRGLDLVSALDVQSAEELDWEPDFSVLAGLSQRREERELRLMLEYFNGSSPNGQFFDQRLRYVGFGLFYEF